MKDNFPTVEVTLRHMEHQILAAIGTEEDRIQKEIVKAVRESIKNYNFQNAVKMEVDRVMNRIVREAMELTFRQKVQDTVNTYANHISDALYKDIHGKK